MDKRAESLNTILAPTVSGLGYELLGTEYEGTGKSATLRIFIDSTDGVTADDCQKVSKQVSAVLDVEEPITCRYRLEVSSPGLDRPLFTFEQIQKQMGNTVKLRLKIALDGRRKFTGTLINAVDGNIELQIDEQTFTIAYENVTKANLVPEL